MCSFEHHICIKLKLSALRVYDTSGSMILPFLVRVLVSFASQILRLPLLIVHGQEIQ